MVCSQRERRERKVCLGPSSPVTLGRILEGEWGLRLSCQPPVGLPMGAELLVLNAEAISTTSTYAGPAWQGCPESAPGSWGSVTLWVPSCGNVTKHCQGRGGSWSTWKQKLYTREMPMDTLWGSKTRWKACVDLWPSDSPLWLPSKPEATSDVISLGNCITVTRYRVQPWILMSPFRSQWCHHLGEQTRSDGVSYTADI